MSDKSFVTMVTNYCPICAKEFETNELLLDKRLNPSFECTTCTGTSLCPEHAAMVENGDFRAFLVCAERDCGRCDISYCSDKIWNHCNKYHYATPDGRYLYRTGEGFLLKTEVARDLFGDGVKSINHCDKELLEEMKSRVQPD